MKIPIYVSYGETHFDIYQYGSAQRLHGLSVITPCPSFNRSTAVASLESHLGFSPDYPSPYFDGAPTELESHLRYADADTETAHFSGRTYGKPIDSLVTLQRYEVEFPDSGPLDRIYVVYEADYVDVRQGQQHVRVLEVTSDFEAAVAAVDRRQRELEPILKVKLPHFRWSSGDPAVQPYSVGLYANSSANTCHRWGISASHMYFEDRISALELLSLAAE